jgi:hypothetical protein
MQDFCQDKEDDNTVDKEHNCSEEVDHINVHKEHENTEESSENDN